MEQRISGLLSGAISSPKPQEEVYKLLLVAYCNAYNKLMPFMFERIKDYTELLMPDDLLSNSSVLTQAVETLDAETCKDVEVIGWLYQYYISEKKDQVFAGLKKGKKISKDDVPAATQIFTPEWIVKYMVENSVGKMWLESHPNKELQTKFKYYLESAEQEDAVKAKLKEIANPNLKPQEIKVLDPACGSGHILVKAFDVLYEIYKAQGYPENEIPEMILTHNLFGLDICDRAAQLSQLAVMMKAREYDRNIFNKVKSLNICSIHDTNWIDFSIADELLIETTNKDKATKQIKLLQETFKDAKEYGSILKVEGLDFDFWDERINYYHQKKDNTLHGQIINGRLKYIIKQAKIMQQQYECIITNPPYMGARKGMNPKLKTFIDKHYNISKSDLYATFLDKSLKFAKDNMYVAVICQHSYMFTDDYKELRKSLLENTNYVNMLHLGTNAFPEINGEVVQVATFILKKGFLRNYKSLFVRLIDFSCEEKKLHIQDKKYHYLAKNEYFNEIQGCPIAYWLSVKMRNTFKSDNNFDAYGIPRQGLATGDNDKFLRFWNEVNYELIGFKYNSVTAFHLGNKTYLPYNKGGKLIKWYGNNDYVIKFDRKNYDILSKQGNHLPSKQYYCLKCITWSDISGRNFAARYCDTGFVFDVKGSCGFPKQENFYYILSLLNSKLTPLYIDTLNPTQSTQVGDLKRIPILFPSDMKIIATIDKLGEQNYIISKDNYDSFETSWDFEQHPLIAFKTGGKIKDSFNTWAEYMEKQFNQLKANEEELNRLFIEIYGLQDEMTPEVADKDITVAKADEEREIKSLISYAVGCMFGRYSLDAKGLIYAGGDFDVSKYKIFSADEDNVIPVLSEHYFTDDIVERFNKFIKVAFGERYYAENMAYIASVLSTKANKSPDQVLREYFIKDFYKDHVQMYQKRPIYWMFSSEKNAFNALIYLHRYNKDTVNLLLNEYLREYKNKLQGNIDALNALANNGGSTTMNKIALQASLNEADDYERNILFPLATERKEIDLDDGVKVNYLKFGKALRNIGLKEKA